VATEEAEAMLTSTTDIDAVVKWIKNGCEGGSIELSDGRTVTVTPRNGARYKERHISAISFSQLYKAPLERRLKGLLDRSEDFTLDITSRELLVCRV